MPVFFTNKKYISYIHIPKAGGSYIENKLSKIGYSFLNNKFPENQSSTSTVHLTSAEIANILNKFNIRIDFEFTIVRDPYHKLESKYFYNYERIFRGSNIGLKSFKDIKNFRTFNNYIISSIEKTKKFREYDGNHFKPQNEFVTDNTIIFKFEDKYVKLNEELKKNNIDTILNYNSNSSRGFFSKFYPLKWNRETLDLVNDFYKEDFTKFDYKMI